MTHRYSTAFSSMILAGTSFYCLYKYKDYNCDWQIMGCGSFLIVVTNSLLGMWRWGNPDHGEKVERPYNLLSFIQKLTTLPFIVTQMWLKYEYIEELAYLHTILTVLPLHLYVANKYKQEVLDIMIAVNCTSLSIISFTHQNYYGVSASFSYLINHFILTEETLEFDELPILDLYNYGLCFFCYFALCALK